MASVMKEQGTSVEFWSDVHMPYVETRRACASRACYKAHSHPTFSIGAVDQGNSIFTSHFGGTQQIDAGTLVLVPAHVEHACNPVPDQAWSYQMMHLDARWLNQLLQETAHKDAYQDIPQFKPVLYKQPKMYHDFSCLNSQLFDTALSYWEKEQTLITTLTELLFPYIQLEFLAPQHYAQQEFKQLLSMIQDADVFLSLEQMSQEVQLSRYAIIRLFKSSLGMTPHAYQLNHKINDARTFLKQGMDIAQLSYTLGFSDQSHFHRVFKNLTGTTPKLYQKQHRAILSKS